MWKILRHQLECYPYKLSVTFQLNETDFERRMVLCSTLLAKGEAFLRQVVWSDEAHFRLDGNVNRQNVRSWATEKPKKVVQMPLHSERVTVWAAFSCIYKVQLFFFDSTINSERYVVLIKEHLLPYLRAHHRLRHCVYQHDWARPHVSNVALDTLTASFPAGIISQRQGLMAWPPRSPDLTPVDFFLWGYLKSKVYANPRPTTLAQLRARIAAEYEAIPQETIQKTVLSIVRRCRMCLLRGGQHLGPDC